MFLDSRPSAVKFIEMVEDPATRTWAPPSAGTTWANMVAPHENADTGVVKVTDRLCLSTRPILNSRDADASSASRTTSADAG